MAKPHTYSEAERNAWVAYYDSNRRHTATQVAEHFGVSVSQVRRELQRQRDRAKGREGGASEYNTDPYGAAMSHIVQALRRGLANSGGMSQGEYDTLVALRNLLEERDHLLAV